MSEEFKLYRLQLIADAVEKVAAERELERQMNDEFKLDEVDCDN